MTLHHDPDTLPRTPTPPGQAALPRPPSGVRSVTSAQLFTTHDEVQIEHHGAIYRLKRTSLGKLILTK